MRDDNWQQLQEQEEEQQYIKERNALSDAEFFEWLDSIEKVN